MDTDPVPTTPTSTATTRTPASPPADPLAALSYEQARDELVSVVARLETGGATLEESLLLWERGEALAARCQQWLDGARQRLSTARGPAAVDGSAANGSAGADGEAPGGFSNQAHHGDREHVAPDLEQDA